MIFFLAGSDLQVSEWDRIQLLIQAGNSKELSKYFNERVDLTIIDKEETYSRAQAEMVLKDFFEKNRPVSCKIIHRGASEGGILYGVGDFLTDKETFRITIKMRQKGSVFIEDLRFERH